VPKFRELLKYFVLDLDAETIDLLTKSNRNTMNRYLHIIRKRIADLCEQVSPFQREIEVDESYFGAKRIKGKRGRGAGGKTPVFGILQRKGNVYSEAFTLILLPPKMFLFRLKTHLPERLWLVYN